MSGTAATARSSRSTEIQAQSGFHALMRGALRSVRPLFAPLLNRLQLRMQSAVEQSSLVPRLQVIEAEAQLIKATTLGIGTSLQDGQAKAQHVRTRLQEAENRLLAIEIRLGESQTQLADMFKDLDERLLCYQQQQSRQIETQAARIVDALDLQITKQIQSHRAELAARLDVLQVTCDVLRLNQIEFSKPDRQGAVPLVSGTARDSQTRQQ